jgi:RNA polymerase sigma factor (sigma-70 family)
MDARMRIDPDGELIERAGLGDAGAAQALMARHLPKMLALARRMLSARAEAEAEDAVQDAFLKVWQHAARWKPGRSLFATWLYRVVLNACYDRLRRRPTLQVEAAAEKPDDAPLPDAGLESAETAAAVRAALASLPERQRAAVLLCHFEEMGNIRAAEILGLSVEALESLLARGRRALRLKLRHLRED